MKILLPYIEEGYASCDHDYNQEEDERFMELLSTFENAPDAYIHFESLEEFYFEGMVESDKKKFNKTIENYIE